MSTSHVEAPPVPSTSINWWRWLRRGGLVLITLVAMYVSLRFGILRQPRPDIHRLGPVTHA